MCDMFEGMKCKVTSSNMFCVVLALTLSLTEVIHYSSESQGESCIPNNITPRTIWSTNMWETVQ